MQMLKAKQASCELESFQMNYLAPRIAEKSLESSKGFTQQHTHLWVVVTNENFISPTLGGWWLWGAGMSKVLEETGFLISM